MIRKLVAIFSLLFLISCEQTDPGPVNTGSQSTHYGAKGVFLMNEGNFTRGNGSVSFYSSDSSKIYNNIFLAANRRRPGDIPFSMLAGCDTIYVIVNNSGKIEMIDPGTFVSVKTLAGLVSPRYLCRISGRKGYVSSLYSEQITIIDLKSLEITGNIYIGSSTEMMVSTPSKVYAASWSGGRKITIIDPVTDMVINSINVVLEPESMVPDKNGLLWVLCSGGYMKEETPALIALDTETDMIAFSIAFPSSSYPSSLSINKGGDTLYYLDGDVFRMSISDRELPQLPFIRSEGRLFYKVEAGAGNGEIFVTDARDYQHNGYLLKYSTSGELLDIEEAGIIPGAMTFMTK